jgi:hypothetical protein
MDQIQSFLQSKRWVYTLLITAFLFLITYLKFGCYYVEYEGLNTGLISGKLTPGLPFKSFFFIGNFGLSYLYSYVYTSFPHIEWLSYFYAIYLFSAVYLGLHLVHMRLPKSVSLWAIFGIETACFVLVFMDHNINFIYTRVAYLVCAMSLYSLLALYRDSGSISKRKALFVLLILFYLIGALTRIEASLAVLLLLCCFGLFYFDSALQLAKVLILPAFITLSLTWYAGETIKSTHEFYAQVEPDIEAQYLNRNNIISLSEIKTRKDSVLYQAASSLMWSDPEIITPTYLRSLIKQDEKPLFTDIRQWHRVFKTDLEVLANNKILTIVCLLLGLGVLIAFRSRDSIIKNFSLLVWVSSFWGLIIMQTYVFKLNDRSFIPLISVFIFGHLFLLSGIFFNRFSIKKLGFGLVSIPLIFIQFYNTTIDAYLLKTEWKVNRANYNTIKKATKNSTLVLNASSFDYIFLANTPFAEFDVSIADRIYIVDGYTIPFMPYYRAYLEKECNLNIMSLPSFINYLKQKGNAVTFVSTPSRIKVMNDYLKEIRGINLKVMLDTNIHLQAVQKTENINLLENLAVYHLSGKQ